MYNLAPLPAAFAFGQVDSTSTSTVFTATVPGVASLYDGLCVYLRNGIVTSASGWTLNVNGLGAKPVYHNMAAATAVTTTFNINYSMLFIYNSTRVSGGCWDIFYGFYSDSNNFAYRIRRGQNDSVMKNVLYRYQIVFTGADGELIAANTVSNSTGTAKSLTTEAFDPFKPIFYYAATGTVNAGSKPATGYLYTAYEVVYLNYAFNAGSTLTADEPVYIRLVDQQDGTVKLDGNNCIVQALPSTDDGKLYLYLGKAYSAVYITLDLLHPIYQYKDGIKLWTNSPHSVSSVEVNKKLSSGVEIGSVIVDGVETKLYAPSGSGGSSPTVEDITADCSITRTSGGSATLVSAIRCGNMLGLVITATSSASIEAGDDIFSGTFNGPTPLVGGAAPGYYGGRALACIISPEKTINVRYMAGSSNYASGKSTTFRLNFLVGD